MRATGLSSLGDYCAWVFQADHLEGEREHLLNAVTTNKTDFFREPKHFDYLMGTVMPHLRDQGSAGCGCGARPARRGGALYAGDAARRLRRR